MPPCCLLWRAFRSPWRTSSPREMCMVWPACRARSIRLGPSYIKMGQFLSTRPDIVGTKVALELESLQDRVTPMSRQAAIDIVEAAFGAKIDTLFASFGEPVAAASIAQVHRATVRTIEGAKPVAVKVLRAGVERRFARDLCRHVLRRAARGASGGGNAPPATRSGGRKLSPGPCGWRWTSGSRPRLRPSSPRTRGTTRTSGRRRSTGIARPAKS